MIVIANFTLNKVSNVIKFKDIENNDISLDGNHSQSMPDAPKGDMYYSTSSNNENSDSC